MANKILIVDDEPFNLDLLEQELMDHDYIIERAGDGVEALEKADSFEPDLLLLDYMMPKMNGVEVVKQLRAHEKHRRIPVILLTAKATQEDKIAGLDAGADDYVTKPFDSFELLARVRAMLRIKELHDQLDEWNRTLTEKVQHQVNELQRMEKLRGYLAPQIAETILGNEAELFKTHRREITAVFLDLRGFTAFSENAEPEEVIQFLRQYHEEMGKLVFKHEGTLERFVGDGIVVIFNDPILCENHPQKAVSMALDMRDRVAELRPGWIKKGFDLDLGVGLSVGYATLGTIGFEGRMDYGTIGNVANLAARLCAEAKGGQVLTDQKSLTRIEDQFDSEFVGEHHLKGINRPIMTYNIVSAK